MRHMTLAAARKRAKLTVSELARRTGVNRITIQRLERGRTLPSYDTKRNLERELNTSLTFARHSEAA